MKVAESRAKLERSEVERERVQHQLARDVFAFQCNIGKHNFIGLSCDEKENRRTVDEYKDKVEEI